MDSTDSSYMEYRRKASADKALAPIVEESRKLSGLFKGQAPKMSPEVCDCAVINTPHLLKIVCK